MAPNSWETQTTTISKDIPFFLVLNAAFYHNSRIRNNWVLHFSGLFYVRSPCTFLQPRLGSVFCCLLIDDISLQISPQISNWLTILGITKQSIHSSCEKCIGGILLGHSDIILTLFINIQILEVALQLLTNKEISYPLLWNARKSLGHWKVQTLHM